VRLIHGDAMKTLQTLPAASVHCCITSPPFYGLRDYGCPDQLGLEATPEEYVANLVAVFREVKRVLRDDGTLWLNLGDSYASGSGHTGRNDVDRETPGGRGGSFRGGLRTRRPGAGNGSGGQLHGQRNRNGIGSVQGAKPKDLLGIPWRVAFALQADGWTLRSDIIWAKPNPMPESVRDRPTKAHEYLFLLSKKASYYYDAEAVREPHSPSTDRRLMSGPVMKVGGKKRARMGQIHRGSPYAEAAGRNRRSVWSIATQSFKGAHFATFPVKLIEPCVLAGTSARGCCPACAAPWARVVERHRVLDGERCDSLPPIRAAKGTMTAEPWGIGKWRTGSVSNTTGWRPTCACPAADPVPCTLLDPFAGACTTGLVAQRHGRDFIGIDVNADYLEMGRQRIEADRAKQPLFAAS
jgi:DNA modification methylase